MIHFYIVRHGETLLNSLKKAQGWCDSPLTDMGIQTAIDLGTQLRDISFNAVYTSDTMRAIQTAKFILASSNNEKVKIQKDIRLREWCLGSMEAEQNTLFIQTVKQWLGQDITWKELNSRLPEVAEALYQYDTTGMVEPFCDIVKRIESLLSDIIHQTDLEKESHILIITHAFMIKTLYYLYAPEQLSRMDRVKNADIKELIYDKTINCFKFL